MEQILTQNKPVVDEIIAVYVGLLLLMQWNFNIF